MHFYSGQWCTFTPALTRGVPQDLVRAFMWFDLAWAQGIELAKVSRDKVAKFMSHAHIAEAQKLAREWRPKN